MNRLMRHIEAANNVTLPAGRTRFLLGGTPVGWVLPELGRELCRLGCRRSAAGIALAAPEALPDLARMLADDGWFRWRDEAFDVRAEDDEGFGPPLATIDRGALPMFGIVARGVHLNGLVQAPDGPLLWVARRSATKLLDPGKLDHLVAGGIGAGLSPMQTLIKEAAEEAGLPAPLAARATPVSVIGYCMVRDEGLRRDRLHCYDLWLPADVRPSPNDGEVADFALWPMPDVLRTLVSEDSFKFNVSLVLIDLLLRTGYIDEASADGRALRAALTAGHGAET